MSATPGSGKSLLATEMMLNLSRDNIANLKHNFFYAKAFFEKLNILKLEEYLDLVLITSGQGLERKSEIIFLEPDHFEFLKEEYFINVISNHHTDDIVNNFPTYYFERIALLNHIIDNINTNEDTKFQHFKPVRTIYTNLADLKLVQCRPLPPNCDWRTTPQGSYFVIDEAQLIPIFSDEAKGIDPIVKDLTIHRHKGYDFLFITQEPSFVHKYIRKLASLHIHLVNIFGWEQSMKMEWSVVQDSPNAIKSMARAENISRWRFPKHVYNLYKSTTINTRQKRIPKKLVTFVLLAVALLSVALFLIFGTKMNNPLVSVMTGQPISKPVETKKMNQSTNNKIQILIHNSQLQAHKLTYKFKMQMRLLLVLQLLILLKAANHLMIPQIHSHISPLLILPLSIIVFFLAVFARKRHAQLMINRELKLMDSIKKLVDHSSKTHQTDRLITLQKSEQSNSKQNNNLYSNKYQSSIKQITTYNVA
ncbi:zonular occludens toxin domain-containing protein [Acinetobacter soli]|nr:zonular occludens toxin domain-containing protein [Acinetobacter soli]WEI15669.1 zonular occludens toxin domain-containing protein [Acinetobacter soli]